jgi:hypothetical protein
MEAMLIRPFCHRFVGFFVYLWRVLMNTIDFEYKYDLRHYIKIYTMTRVPPHVWRAQSRFSLIPTKGRNNRPETSIIIHLVPLTPLSPQHQHHSTALRVNTSFRNELNVAPRPMAEMKQHDEVSAVSNVESVLMSIEENEDTNRQLLEEFLNGERPKRGRSLLVKAVRFKNRSRACLGPAPQDNDDSSSAIGDVDCGIPSSIQIPLVGKRSFTAEMFEKEYRKDFTNSWYMHEESSAWRSLYDYDPEEHHDPTEDSSRMDQQNRPPRHPTSNKPSTAMKALATKDRLAALACVICTKKVKEAAQEEATGATESGDSGKPESSGNFNHESQLLIVDTKVTDRQRCGQRSMYSF